MLDDVMIKAVNAYAGLQYEVKPTLFFEFSGNSIPEMNEKLMKAQEVVKNNGATGIRTATDPTENTEMVFF
jgi:hypothetical protein